MSAILGAARGIGAARGRLGGLRRGARRIGGMISPGGIRRRRRRRGRGISMAGIRAARRLLNLLRDFQAAVPRGRHLVAPRRRRRFFGRPRRGDIGDFGEEGDE